MVHFYNISLGKWVGTDRSCVESCLDFRWSWTLG